MFVADGSKGIVAVYTGAQSNTVEDDPLNHMDRVIFHSDLPYVDAVQTVTGETMIPAPSNTQWAYYSSVNLFAHGLSYTPLVIPLAHDVYDYNGGLWSTIPANLAFPNWRVSPLNYFNPPAAQADGQVGLTNIFANDTHVVATTMFNKSFGSIRRYNLKFTVHVTNVALSGTVNPPTSSDLILMDEDEVTIAGKFSSKDTHLSESGPGDEVYFPMGGTLANEGLGFRAMAITFGGSKFIGCPYGTKSPYYRPNVASEGGGISTGSTTAKATSG
ncbi:hypothetical protein LP7551_02058 [Roseibium album]|nr:hypothetical protein LP7551_02058 [Roseibium album]